MRGAPTPAPPAQRANAVAPRRGGAADRVISHVSPCDMAGPTRAHMPAGPSAALYGCALRLEAVHPFLFRSLTYLLEYVYFLCAFC